MTLKMHTPIQALNPYEGNATIKAKIVKKFDMRSFTKNGDTIQILTAELVDKQGCMIQASFWREAAVRCNDLLQEGKVYLISKFKVKPSNKQYSTVRNDYELHMDNRTEVKESEDQDSESMTVKIDPVPLAELQKYVNRKAAVDILGIVTSVGQLGTVKRKADSTELARRDITIVDQSMKSVTITLWGANATDIAQQLEGKTGQVLQCTCCRVTDFNGISLSTLTRSDVSIDPDNADGRELQRWWAEAGQSASFTPVVEPGTPTSGPGGERRQARVVSLADVQPAAGAVLPATDAKPEYHTVLATVAYINPEQTLYYLANPENGRKVVPQDGRYLCEFDGKVVDVAEHRYVLSLKATDYSGECWLNAFNKEGEELLSAKADELAEMKGGEDGAAGVAGVLRRAQWREWLLTLQSRSREYNGELRMRHTIVSCRPADYADQAARLLKQIALYDA